MTFITACLPKDYKGLLEISTEMPTVVRALFILIGRGDTPGLDRGMYEK